MAFGALLEPCQIGSLTLKNRIKLAAMDTGFCTADGFVTGRERDFLVERAKGGAGLVTTGGGHVTSWGRLWPGVISTWDDRFIAGLSDLARAIKGNGAKACGAVIHHGRYAGEAGESVGPSSIPPRNPRFHTPRALTIPEIGSLVVDFSEAAGRVKRAGFDCVEVCGNAGYLIASFLSPLTNRRDDGYGGSFEKRSRFLLEVIGGVRRKVGKNYPIIVRLCGDELMEGGNTPEEMCRIAQLAERAGMDAISVSVGWHESRTPVITMDVRPGQWLYLAEKMKKALNVPVMMAYRLNDPSLAEQALRDGKLDIWEAARPLIADPELPRKVAEDRADDIRPCVGCCQRCFDHSWMRKPIGCTVNPRAGNEGDIDYQVKPAAVRKKVAVVGGGPAGLTAAIVAKQRGHKVTLYERRPKLGGLLLTAAVPPHKGELSNLTAYLTRQTQKVGVEAKLGAAVSDEDLRAADYDVVVLATGSKPLVPPIQGIRGDNVVTAVDVLNGASVTGNEIVVIGGGMVGCETAELLAAKGKRVTIVEMRERIGQDFGPTVRWTVLDRLRKAGIAMKTRTTVIEITEEGVKTAAEGHHEFVSADSVVLAAGAVPNTEIVASISAERDYGPRIHAIGDCNQARRIGDAIEEAFLLGCRI